MDDPLWPGTDGNAVPQSDLELNRRTAPAYGELAVPEFDEKDYQSESDSGVTVNAPGKFREIVSPPSPVL